MNGKRTEPLKREREIFLEALERTTPGERAAFLDEACAQDPSLRAAVEGLLEHHQEDGFMASPAIHAPTGGAPTQHHPGGAPPAAAGEQPGEQIGHYRLLQQIGEGGVGVVFMAGQDAPVRRRVALKVLKPGMDNEPILARPPSAKYRFQKLVRRNKLVFAGAGVRACLEPAAGRPRHARLG